MIALKQTSRALIVVRAFLFMGSIILTHLTFERIHFLIRNKNILQGNMFK